MQGLILNVGKLSKGLAMIAKVFLTFSILLTVADVILRSFRRPIFGTYELVALSSAVIFGFSLPFTSWMRGHVSVDFLTPKLPQSTRKIFNVVMKCAGIGLFFLFGSTLIALGMDLRKAGEVSVLLHLPFYPVVYGIGVCCFLVCLVLFCDIVKIFGGKYE